MFVYQFLVCLFVEKFRVKIKHACEFIAEQEQERDRGFTHGSRRVSTQSIIAV